MSKKDELIKIHGEECMIEATDRRYIPQEERRRIKGYRKSDDRIYQYKDYLIKGYNLKWLRKQSKDKQEEIEKDIDEYKIHIAKMKIGKSVEMEAREIGFDGFDMSDTMEIPLVANEIERKEEKER